MLRSLVAALACICRTAAEMNRPPPDTHWRIVGSEYDLRNGPLCLAPLVGTTIPEREPIKLLMPPSALEVSYVMAILLRERLGYDVQLVNPLGVDVDPEQQLYLARGCLSEDGVTAAGSPCDLYGVPDMIMEVLDSAHSALELRAEPRDTLMLTQCRSRDAAPRSCRLRLAGHRCG